MWWVSSPAGSPLDWLVMTLILWCADLHMTPENVVSRLLQTERLGLPKCMAACEAYILAHRKDIPDLHILPAEWLLKLLLR